MWRPYYKTKVPTNSYIVYKMITIRRIPCGGFVHTFTMCEFGIKAARRH